MERILKNRPKKVTIKRKREKKRRVKKRRKKWMNLPKHPQNNPPDRFLPSSPPLSPPPSHGCHLAIPRTKLSKKSCHPHPLLPPLLKPHRSPLGEIRDLRTLDQTFPSHYFSSLFLLHFVYLSFLFFSFRFFSDSEHSNPWFMPRWGRIILSFSFSPYVLHSIKQ